VKIAFVAGVGLAIHLAAFAGDVSADPWQPFGLADHGTDVLATHRSISGPMLIGFGYPATRITMSTDAGAHVRHTFEFAPSTLQATSRQSAIVVGSPTQIFANISAVPWWSPDEGRSWAYVPWVSYPPIDVGGGYRMGGVNPANPDERVVFYGTTMAVTDDRGATWRVDPVPFNVKSMTVDWLARRVYASGLSSFAARALDVVGSWITQSDRWPYAAQNGIVVARMPQGIVRSPDGGATFVPVGAALGTINACAIEFAPSSSDVAYVVDCGPPSRVLRSTDAGQTWNAVADLPALAGGYSGVPTALAVDAIDADRVWIGDQYGVRQSIDGGTTFERLARSTGSSGVGRPIFFDATDPLRQWMGGRGILRTQDGGTTWEDLTTPSYGWIVVWASRARSNVVLGYSGSNTFYRTALSVDGGVTWSDKIVVGADAGANPRSVVDGSQPGEVYLFQKNNSAEYLWSSTNDGESWTPHGPAPAVALAASASKTAPTVVYFGVDVPGDSIGLYRATDGGSIMSAVTTLPTGGAISAVAVAPSDASIVYAGYRSPNPYAILRSVDAGATWLPAASGLGAGPVTSIVVSPASSSTVYAAQQGSGVFRSVDGGATWQAMDEGLLGASASAYEVRLDPHDANRLVASTSLGQFEVDLANGAPWGDGRAIEFFHRDFNHYFVSSNLDEIAGLDAGVFYGWARTGEDFRVGIPDGRGRGFVPVCRFFGVGFAPLSSHFYTPYPNECDVVNADPKWLFEKIAFGLALPDIATRGCPLGTRPLYRLWNRNQDGAPNHRYTTSTLTFDEMIGEGWIFEGEKETRVFACVPN
jgi:photosystem II stability/assembly factor-like uncharacterized protein